MYMTGLLQDISCNLQYILYHIRVCIPNYRLKFIETIRYICCAHVAEMNVYLEYSFTACL